MKKLMAVFIMGILLLGFIFHRKSASFIKIPEETLNSLCYGLDESSCLGTEVCRPKYEHIDQNKCPKGEFCTTEYKLPYKKFLYCEKIPSDELYSAKTNKKYCVGEYATWSENEKPGRCFCGYTDFSNEQREYHGYVDFVEGYGCITARELCEKLNGVFEPDPSNAYEWCNYPDGTREHVYIPETSKKLEL